MKTVVGFEPVSYTSQKTGQPVSGVRFYILSPLTPPAVGNKCEECFISGYKVADARLGDILTVITEPTFNGNYRAVDIMYVGDPRFFPAEVQNKK